MTAPNQPVDPRDDDAAADLRRWISALADGDAQAVNPATQAWREQPEARETWHLYHLIGDVLRSDDLASTPARDAAFLAGIRQRLAQEPVPLAPAPLPAAAADSPGHTAVRRLGWRAPAAVAAGFAVVTAGFVALQPGSHSALDPMTPVIASSTTTASPAGHQAVPVGAPVITVGTASGNMLRNVNLDSYLAAHQAVRGAPVTTPMGGWRNVEERLQAPTLVIVAPASGAAR